MGTHPRLTDMKNLGNLYISCIDMVYNGHLLKASRKLQKLSDVLICCKCEQSCALGCLLDVGGGGGGGGHYQYGAEIMERRSVKYCLIQLFEEMVGSLGRPY